MKKTILFSTFLVFFLFTITLFSQPIIIDHNCTNLDSIPIPALQKATKTLHIAYGHTSHGSQIIGGMNGLQKQSTDLLGYKGDYYCWDEYHEVYGNNPCLDVDDNFVSGDLGHNGNTSWAERTRNYLLNSSNAKDINVVMWSWCGGCSDNTDQGIQKYLDAMNSLENEFKNISFIYMTGHLDHNRDTQLKHNNQLIRDYCIANNKVLFDFADIESYDPDGIYYEYSNDDCSYYDSNGNKIGNWATEWQSSHEKGKYWFDCHAAHSQPLNGNRKGYAAWWMWARIAGWNPNQSSPKFTKQPEDITVCGLDTVSFSVECPINSKLQWQKLIESDSTFIDLDENNTFSGVNSENLLINVNDYDLSYSKFRCKLESNGSKIYTDTVVLITYQTINAIIQSEDFSCNKTIQLKAKNPSPGTGKWKVLFGDASIIDINSPLTLANNLSYGENIFLWSVQNGICTDSTRITINKSDSIKIIQNPTDIIINIDSSVSFNIVVSGDIISYQWKKDGIDLQNNDNYSGVGKSILKIINTNLNLEGDYSCNINGICNKKTSKNANLRVLTNNSNLSLMNINIFPNPAKNKLYINTTYSIDKLTIINLMTGQKMLEIADFNNESINISSLESGTYFIKIKIKENIFTKKIHILK